MPRILLVHQAQGWFFHIDVTELRLHRGRVNSNECANLSTVPESDGAHW